MTLRAAARLIITIGRRLWEQGLLAAAEGNISILLDNHRILTTPSGVSKGLLEPRMLILVDRQGLPLRKGRAKPSSEIRLHLKAYDLRPDIRCVIHAHPPYATAFAAARIPLDIPFLPEAVQVLGAVRVAPYATPSTDKVPASAEPFIRTSDAVLLANHGALALGTDPLAACHRMETLEQTAKILWLSLALGGPSPLPQDEVRRLLHLRKTYGLSGPLDTAFRKPQGRSSSRRPK